MNTIDFKNPKIQEQILSYFMFTDKNKIPIDQFMTKHTNDCYELGKTIQEMIKEKHIKSLYIDRITHEVLYS